MSGSRHWDPTRDPNALAPADRMAAVADFLVRCRAWSTEREIPKRLAALAADPDPKTAASLHAWASYVAFLDHALAELPAGQLDHWFTRDEK